MWLIECHSGVDKGQLGKPHEMHESIQEMHEIYLFVYFFVEDIFVSLVS